MPPPTRLIATATLAVLTLASPDRSPAQSPHRGRLSGTWLGQDGHDFVGPSSKLAPSDVQDLHIRLAGLPIHDAIARAVIRGLGGDEWQVNGPYGPWKAHLIRREGAATADLFLEPTRGRDRPRVHHHLDLRRRPDRRADRRRGPGRPEPPHARREAEGLLGRPGRPRPRRHGTGGRAGWRAGPGASAGEPLAGDPGQGHRRPGRGWRLLAVGRQSQGLAECGADPSS